MRYEITCSYEDMRTGHYGSETFDVSCEEGLMLKILKGLRKTDCENISACASNGTTYTVDGWSGKILVEA